MTDPQPVFRDPDQPLDQRVNDLISRMTLQEKVEQLYYDAPAIERLGIPRYNWWSECLHGVGRGGIATVFPQCIGMAASWNPELLERVATAIGDEARARYHELAERRDDRTTYKGLTFFTPNVNIFRDPRWGRGQETYGECPYLSSRMGAAFVRGLQGEHSHYMKAAATAKHYVVHSGPEPERHTFDARVSLKDLYETYLPAFRACVVEAGAASVMGAYNRTNGESCCASELLLDRILRRQWGFAGYVVSDLGAVTDIHAGHKLTSDACESIALAMKTGLDLGLDRCYRQLGEAVERGLVSEAEVERALRRVLPSRFRLGMFDPPGHDPYEDTPYETNDCEEHRELALHMARESIVLLKNEDGLLPLSEAIGSVLVVGPTADDRTVLLGNYAGTPSEPMTVLDGVRARIGGSARVWYAQGADLVDGLHGPWVEPDRWLSEALAMADRSEVIIACVGLAPRLEGEEGAASLSEKGGDRESLEIPAPQMRMLRALHATGKPVVAVLTGGSPLAVGWLDENIPAILDCWYGGQAGGRAVADVLWGDYNPAGRLPVTFVRSVEQLPPFEDYAMEGRTYRYLEEEPLYPFGFGLSYTTFRYDNLEVGPGSVPAGEPVTVSADVTNTGERAGDEVVQLYLTDEKASERVPIRQLRGVRRIHLQPGQTARVEFELGARDMAMVNAEGRHVVEPGWFMLTVGGRQSDSRSEELATSNILTGRFEATGEAVILDW